MMNLEEVRSIQRGADGTRWFYGELACCFAKVLPSDRLSRGVQAFDQ
jgi:hypothetical protein